MEGVEGPLVFTMGYLSQDDRSTNPLVFYHKFPCGGVLPLRHSHYDHGPHIEKGYC